MAPWEKPVFSAARDWIEFEKIPHRASIPSDRIFKLSKPRLEGGDTGRNGEDLVIESIKINLKGQPAYGIFFQNQAVDQVQILTLYH